MAYSSMKSTAKVVHKAYKFRLYPTGEQRTVLHKHFGHCRFVYNHFLAERMAFYEANKDKPKGVKKSLNYSDNQSVLPKLKKATDTEWLKEVNSQSLQVALQNLDKAYQRFFKEKKGFPRFKSKKHKQSFTVPQRFTFFSGVKPTKTLFGSKEIPSKYSWLKIPNLPKSIPLLKVKAHRKLPKEARILFVTISKTPTNKYFASLTCEVTIQPKAQPQGVPKGKIKAVGIDLGIKDLVILSDGRKVENPKYLKKGLKKLKYNQRQLSKKKKGGKNRERARQKFAKIHEKVTNKRKDLLHKISSQLVEEQTVVCMESLQVKNMVKNHKLAQAIIDASWGELTRQLNYKAGWHHRVVVQIDKWFPSSKMCSCCGHVLDELPLKVRKWKCPKCKITHDRDQNATLNILQEGLIFEASWFANC